MAVSDERELNIARRRHANALFLFEGVVPSTDNLLESAERSGGVEAVASETSRIENALDARDLLLNAYKAPSSE